MRKTPQSPDLQTLPSASPNGETSLQRRRVLFALSAGGAATAAPAAAVASLTQPAGQAEPGRSSGYHETAHVRSYYASTRI